MDKQKVSIVVPCYNVEKYIMRCLKSIENQTYGIENLEIILIDDASPDSVGCYLDAFKSKYPNNVIVAHLPVNKGVSAARNIGIDLAGGKYLLFVDSDDVIHPSMIEKMVTKAEEFNCEFVQCKHRNFDGIINFEEQVNDGNDRLVDLSNIDEKKNYIIASIGLFAWNKLFLKKFVDDNNIRFPEGCYYEDQPFSLMAVIMANSYYSLDEELYYYFISNQESIVHSGYSFKKERGLVYSAEYFYEEMKKRPEYNSIMEQLYYELQVFYLWRVYIVAHGMLMDELEWYKKHILSRYPDLLNSPYVTNICDPAIMKVIDTLRNDN